MSPDFRSHSTVSSFFTMNKPVSNTCWIVERNRITVDIRVSVFLHLPKRRWLHIVFKGSKVRLKAALYTCVRFKLNCGQYLNLYWLLLTTTVNSLNYCCNILSQKSLYKLAILVLLEHGLKHLFVMRLQDNIRNYISKPN